MSDFEVGNRVQMGIIGHFHEGNPFGMIIEKRKIDINFHPLTGDKTDGYSYRVKYDSPHSIKGLGTFESGEYYSNELRRIEEET